MNRATAWRGERDFGLEIARGQVGGFSIINVFGHNPDVGTAAYEDVWYAGGTYPYPTSALAVRVKAGGDAADDGAGGSGARTIRVEGLDENMALAQDTITTNGVGVGVAGTVTFFRVFYAYVLTAGTYGGSNVADVVLETTAGTTIASIQAGRAQTQIAAYSVPANHSAYMFGFRLSVDTNKDAEIKISRRDDIDTLAAPFSAFRMVSAFSGVKGPIEFNLSSTPFQFPAKTDIRFESIANVSAAAVSISFDLVLVSDT
jgi:hypothetical protein